MNGCDVMDQYVMVSSVIIFVENRLQTGFEYAELEKAVGFSLSHIRSVFSKLTGKSLSRYVLSRRIAHAAFDISHSDKNILDIATKYGFSNPDSFTRAFKRITGFNPSDFRRQKRSVGRTVLTAGVFGVSINFNPVSQKEKEGIVKMNNHEQRHVSDGSVVLYGVPKVHYGAFGGITPLPICMKAAANYMGIELDYTDAIVYCGMAFRLSWNETTWDGGNVGDIFTFDDPSKVFRRAIESIGCQFNLIGRSQTTKKAEFINFIKEKIDNGIPVIARGVIGPPEPGIITGYRDNGNILLGWNVFQNYSEYAANVRFDESGYYITDRWWENQSTNALMSFGEITGKRYTVRNVVENAIEVMTPRRHYEYAKAGYAYEAWKKALLDESQINKDMVSSLLVERLMCHQDAVDCLADGRKNAYKYFKKLADKNPKQPLYAKIAERFAESAACALKMYQVLGGWERGEKQIQALASREIREKIGYLIDECKAIDEKAWLLLQDLLKVL
jgi:AraC-like DNA-binding protein